MIEKGTENWVLKRMAAVDRNILRFAAYEIFFRKDIPSAVTINEALEIAKKFSSSEAASFLNGVLDKLAHEGRQSLMRCAILSDVHSNLEATEAVLDDIYERGIRDILFIGDAVGYGPNPNECIELLQDRCKVLIAGNHDRASVGLTDIRYFNEYARHAVEWTRDVLTEKNRDILTIFLIIAPFSRRRRRWRCSKAPQE